MKTQTYLRKGYRLAPISLLGLVLFIGGCATKVQVERIEEKVTQVRNDQKILAAKVNAIDSLLIAGTEQDNRLRADVRSSIDDLLEQLRQLQSQIGDLNQLIYAYAQKGTGQTAVQSLPPAQPGTAPAGDSGGAAPSVDCVQLWDNAFKDMRRGQYDLALSGFADYLKFCPEGSYRDNSQYWIAECHYEMDMSERAIEEYQKLISQYPESEKVPLAYFKIGRSYEKLGNQDKALENYLIIQNQFPGSFAHEQCKDKIEEWQKKKEN